MRRMKQEKFSEISSCGDKIRTLFSPFAWRMWITRRRWSMRLYGEKPVCKAFCPLCEYIGFCAETNDNIEEILKAK